jgi:hypothetical protein
MKVWLTKQEYIGRNNVAVKVERSKMKLKYKNEMHWASWLKRQSFCVYSNLGRSFPIQGEFRGWYLEIGHDGQLSHPLHFIFTIIELRDSFIKYAADIINTAGDGTTAAIATITADSTTTATSSTTAAAVTTILLLLLLLLQECNAH